MKLKRNDKEDWKKDFIAVSSGFVKKLKIDKLYLIEAIKEFESAAESIQEVFTKKDDMGDFRENVGVLMSCYFKSNSIPLKPRNVHGSGRE